MLPCGVLPGGELAPVVGPAGRIEADLVDGGDVDDVVGLAVAGAREAVADLLAGGGVQRRGPGPGREPVAVGEPGDVADVGEDACSDDGSDTGEVHQVRAAGNDQRLELFAGHLHLLLDRDHLGELLEREPFTRLADRVAWPHRGQDRLGLERGDVLLRLSWNQFGQQPVQPVDRLDLRLGQLVPPVDQHPQHLQVRVVGQHPQRLGAHSDHGDGVRVVGVGLTVVTGVEQPRDWAAR